MDLPLFKVYWDDDDVEAVTRALKRGLSWAVGPEIAEFEKGISGYLGVKHSVVFNSGTSALHAAMLAHGIGPGDEVIVPSFTFIASSNAPLFTGARPVFADIEEETLGLNPADVESKITPRTRAILPVHFAGGPCRIDEIAAIARKHKLLVVEDAAEALGASVNGRKVGAVGDSGVLSFCQNKIITTGEGGAVVTNSDPVAERLRLIRSHGRNENGDYFTSSLPADYVSLGYNFRMPTMTAALGLAQLRKLDKLVQRRREAARLLGQRLSGLHQVVLPELPADYFHVYQLYPVRIRDGMRDRLMKHLGENGIASKVYFSPIHLTHFYRNVLKYDCHLPVTETVSSEVLALPMHALLTEEEIAYIAAAVKSLLS